MDGQQKKAVLRSIMREAAQKRQKRIDSPLVRYNENDQPVCKVCNVTLKSESLWTAHQVSRKHHEAIESIKATAAGLKRGNNINLEPAAELPKPKLQSSTLPADFFDKQETKKQKLDMGAVGRNQSVNLPVGSGSSNYSHGKKEDSHSVGQSLKMPESVNKPDELADVNLVENQKINQPSKKMDGVDGKQLTGALPASFFDKESIQVKGVPPDAFFDSEERIHSALSNQLSLPSKRLDGSEAKQVKGALPEGFFDSKDADLRARGIEPVKVDVNDAIKEFEKEIQENLQEVDNRLEEEEIDAAEIREEFESFEQKAYREKVEMMKKRLTEVKAARLVRGQKPSAFMGKESSDESSSDEDDDDDGHFAVDWRAKHL